MVGCEICCRSVKTTKHHLIPNCKMKRSKEIRKKKRTINVCEECRVEIHRVFTNEELRAVYNRIFRIKINPIIRKHIKNIRRVKIT